MEPEEILQQPDAHQAPTDLGDIVETGVDVVDLVTDSDVAEVASGAIDAIGGLLGSLLD